MSPITVGKPDKDSPRPQRRHFVDTSLRALQEKILVHAGSVHENHTTYVSDYVDQSNNPTVPKTTERFVRRRFDPALVPLSDLAALNKSLVADKTRPNQRDANKLLYKSTYQENYRQGFQPEAVMPRYKNGTTENNHHADPQHVSLYQESFDKKLPMNMAAIGNPNKQFAIVRKPEFERPEATIRDVFGTSDKPSYITSYSSDFRGFVHKGNLVTPKLDVHGVLPRTEKTKHYKAFLRH